MNTTENNKLIVEFLGQHIFYNFDKQMFDYGVFKHNVSDENKADKDVALALLEKLFEIEQAKSYGDAKPTYLFKKENSKLILLTNK